MSKALERPVPQPDADDGPFWAAAAQGRIVVSQCRQCWRCWVRPTPGCPSCGQSDIARIDATGAGSLYTWVVVNRAMDDSFADDVPYTIVVVDLDEGARVQARLTDSSLALTAGLRMTVTPYLSGEWHLLGARVRREA